MESDRLVQQKIAARPQPKVGNRTLTSAIRAEEAEHGPAPAPVQQAIQSTGQPLAPTLRHKMEGIFGNDFGDVRLHTGDQPAESARVVGARAYTIGPDIVFGRDRFAPGTLEGERLLTHELGHVVQQRNSGQVVGMEAAESEAISVSQSAAHGEIAAVSGSVPAGSLQREPLTKQEIEQLDREALEARLAEIDEESQIMVYKPEYYEQLDQERAAILNELEGIKLPEPPKKSRPPKPPYPADPDAFSGIDYNVLVSDSLPKEDSWTGYRTTKNFSIGVAFRETPEGRTALYYAAAVKWEGMEGPQWIIGPDSIDAFVQNEQDFVMYTAFAPADPYSMSDWQLEVAKAQASMVKGEWKKAFKHIGQSHVEKWSDEPEQAILELLPMPGPKAKPKPQPSIKPPKPRLKPPAPKPKPARTVPLKAKPTPKPSVKPAPKPKAKPAPKPKAKAAPKPKATPTPKPKPAPKPKATKSPTPARPKKTATKAPARKKAPKPATAKKRNQYPGFEDVPASMQKVAAEQTEQLSKQLGIPIPKDRVVSAPWIGRIRGTSGKTRSVSTSQGWLRNESKFWSKWKQAFPEDAKLLGKGNTVTKELAEKYGWPTSGPNNVVGQKLIHHHMSNGSFTVAIPESLHVKLSGKIHAKPTVVP